MRFPARRQDDKAYGVAIQSDGKIVVVGGSDGNFAVARYTSAGSLDETFDGESGQNLNGKITTNFNGTDVAYGVAIQSDGKIVAVGTTSYGANYSDFALARYNTDGALDTTGFGTAGTGGTVVTDFYYNPGSGGTTVGGDDVASGVVILSDGSIIAAGWSAGSTPICYALAKYGSNGVLSTKTASAVSTGSGSAHSAEHSGIALQANAEKVVTAGWVSNGSDNDFFIARYNVSNLGLDTSFDGDGMLSTTFGSGNTDVAYGVAIQPDGRIIAAGSTTTPGSGGATDFAVARYKLPAGLDQRHFAQHDANFNITSITDANGQVAERYLYTPYGEVEYRGGSWESLSGNTTQFAWRYLHQGGRYDSSSGLYYFRNRGYSPALGRWMQQDPMGYVDGMSLYEYVRSNPIAFVDPMGLAATTVPSEKKPINLVQDWIDYWCDDSWSTFYMSMWLQEEDMDGWHNIEKFSLYIKAKNVDGKIQILDSWAGHEHIESMGGGYGNFDATPSNRSVSYIGNKAEVYWKFEGVENPSGVIQVGLPLAGEAVGTGAGAGVGFWFGGPPGAEVGMAIGAFVGTAIGSIGAYVAGGDFGGKGAYTVHVEPNNGGVRFSVGGEKPTTFGDDELRWDDFGQDADVGVLGSPAYFVDGKRRW